MSNSTKKSTKLFIDTEFTGLHQNTTIISIGIISECGKIFYAEYSDYDKSQLDDWLQEHVIDNLVWTDDDPHGLHIQNSATEIYGDRDQIKEALINWLSQFESVLMIADTPTYDWMLFVNIFGTAFDLPKNVYYIPYDISVLFQLVENDSDLCRVDYIADLINNFDYAVPKQYNALFDAMVTKACYEKLINRYNFGREHSYTLLKQ